MNRPRLFALLSTAFVLYVAVSRVANGHVSLVEALGFAASFWLCARVLLLRFERGRDGAATVEALSAAAGAVLASWLSREGPALLGEVLASLLVPFVGVLVLELSLKAPDVPPVLVRHVRSLPLLRLLAIAAAVLGVVAAMPPMIFEQRALIAPAWVARVPVGFALSSLALASSLRWFRARLGSDAKALAASSWAATGIGIALLCAGLAYLANILGAPRSLSIAAATFSTLALVFGHVWLIEPARALVAGPWLREAFALALSLTAVLPLALLGASLWPEHLLARICGFALFAGLLELLRRVALRLVDKLFAPDQGRLLRAIVEARKARGPLLTVADLAARALGPLRRAARLPEAAPVLYIVHPACEIKLDAAGEPRTRARSMPIAIQDHMRDHGLLPIVRDDLSARIVRRPDLRALLQALDLHDTLVALPLVCEGQLEGVLVVARGERSERLTLEELGALETLCGEMAGHLVVLLSAERAHARAQTAASKEQRALGRIEDLQQELASARDRAEVLVRGLTAIESATPVIAYSADMRQLVTRLTQIAPHDVPVLLSAEPGDFVLPLARWVHEHSGRAAGPFVSADLLSLEPGMLFEALVGAQAPGRDRPGWLEMAEGGTLVLCDIAALPHGAQHVLIELLSERRVRMGTGRGSRAANVRLVCTARSAKAELVAAGAMLPELARWLEPTSLHVPPLRERREDLESLVLLAIDRASRALGKAALGISPDALAALATHSFPGNAVELESIVQRAVGKAGSQRVQVTDLPALAATAGAYLGSFVDQEREILRQALERAGGNKTRAATALGLKRTTLIDKLKRHGLDDSVEPIQH